MNEQHGLNQMNKQQLRAKLAADYEAFQKRKEVPLIAAQTSPLEHRMICGPNPRSAAKQRDIRQEAYEEWLQQERRSRM